MGIEICKPYKNVFCACFFVVVILFVETTEGRVSLTSGMLSEEQRQHRQKYKCTSKGDLEKVTPPSIWTSQDFQVPSRLELGVKSIS